MKPQDLAPVLPILTVPDGADAPALAGALLEGGLRAIEITLRTPGALAAITAIKRAYPALLVGAGTIRRQSDVSAARDSGADFLVSPGLTPRLAEALASSSLLALPGVATAGEAMTAAEAGFSALKFFPAEPIGGVSALAALAGPLPDLRFCPTGGIKEERIRDYLALPNVFAVGGSWIAPDALIAAANWREITARAARAAAFAAR